MLINIKTFQVVHSPDSVLVEAQDAQYIDKLVQILHPTVHKGGSNGQLLQGDLYFEESHCCWLEL